MTISIEQFKKISSCINLLNGEEKIVLKQNFLKKGNLSSVQKRMLFVTQALPKQSIYNIAISAKIKASTKIDIETLESALNIIVSENDILRTIFDAKNFKQIVLDNLNIKLNYVDVRNSNNKLQTVKNLIKTYNQAEFTISKLPLFNFYVFQLTNKEYVFSLTIHHIISDGWSNNLIFKKLIDTYKELLETNSLKTPTTSKFQYLDYVVWEENMLNSKAFISKQLSFWDNLCIKDLAPLKLNVNYLNSHKRQYTGKTEEVTLNINTVSKLKLFCLEHSVTMSELFLTVFFIILKKYSSNKEIIIGSATANRQLRELDDMLGVFINTVLYKLSFDEDCTIRDILSKVSSLNRDILSNQNIPFDVLISKIKPARSEMHTQLISAFFIYQNFPKMFEYSEDGVEISPFYIDCGTTKFDISLSAEEVKNKIYLSINYSDELFDSYTIKGMINLYVKLLQNFCIVLDKRLSNVELQKKTRYLLLNQGDAGLFLEGFEEQAATNPEAVAIKCLNNGPIKYSELNDLSNQIARYLKTKISQSGEPVAILMDHSARAIASIIGIMKAGSCYVPLDESIPLNRISYILRDSGAKNIITDKVLVNDVNNITYASILENIPKYSKKNLKDGPKGCNLAYIIYTSGSTGKPKGVCVEHSQLSSYVDAILSNSSFNSCNSFAAITSFATDLGHAMLFPPLMSGKTILIVPNNVSHNPELFIEHFKHNKVDCMKLTPSHVSMYLTYDSFEVIFPKKLLILAGEPLKWELVKKIKKYSDCEIHNNYGPTETTVSIFFYEIKDFESNFGIVPIGYNFKHVQFFILDSDLNSVPTGVSGELYISGNCVSRGYLNLVNLTKSKFIEVDGIKMYRTGDIVRQRKDRAVDFISRIDRQVKISGYRIELDEIESNMSKINGINLSAVIKTKDNLIAYVSTHDKKLTGEIIKSKLSQTLPYYMIPRKIVILEKIPLNAGGKINYELLSEKDIETEITENYIHPRDRIELCITNIWSEILGNDKKISINDDFFSLGGHSISAINLANKLEEKFKINITISKIFQLNTIEKLAQFVKKRLQAYNHDTLICFKKRNSAKIQIFFIHPAGGTVFCYYELAKNLKTDCGFCGIESPELYGKAEYKNIKDMAKHYVNSICNTINDEVFTIVGGWSMGGTVAFEMLQQLAELKMVKNTAFIVIDHLAPTYRNKNKFSDEEAIFDLIKRIEKLSGIYSGISLDSILSNGSIEQVQKMFTFFQKAGIIASDLQYDNFKVFWKLYTRHAKLLDQYYSEGFKFSGNSLIIKAANSDHQKNSNDFLGWDKFCINKPTVNTLPGNHMSILKNDNILALSESIDSWISSLCIQ